ncbi:MAG: hypothetical protein P8X70_01345 [Nanoarchaeota archaeon]
MKKGFIQFITGIVIVLIAVGILLHGNLFGEYNSGIAIVLTILGIGLIATSKYKLSKKK